MQSHTWQNNYYKTYPSFYYLTLQLIASKFLMLYMRKKFRRIMFNTVSVCHYWLWFPRSQSHFFPFFIPFPVYNRFKKFDCNTNAIVKYTSNSFVVSFTKMQGFSFINTKFFVWHYVPPFCTFLPQPLQFPVA
jgi:hypothetical protein